MGRFGAKGGYLSLAAVRLVAEIRRSGDGDPKLLGRLRLRRVTGGCCDRWTHSHGVVRLGIMMDRVIESVVRHHSWLNGGVWIRVGVWVWNWSFGNDAVNSSTRFSWSCWGHVVDCRLHVDVD